MSAQRSSLHGPRLGFGGGQPVWPAAEQAKPLLSTWRYSCLRRRLSQDPGEFPGVRNGNLSVPIALWRSLCRLVPMFLLPGMPILASIHPLCALIYISPRPTRGCPPCTATVPANLIGKHQVSAMGVKTREDSCEELSPMEFP